MRKVWKGDSATSMQQAAQAALATLGGGNPMFYTQHPLGQPQPMPPRRPPLSFWAIWKRNLRVVGKGAAAVGVIIGGVLAVGVVGVLTFKFHIALGVAYVVAITVTLITTIKSLIEIDDMP